MDGALMVSEWYEFGRLLFLPLIFILKSGIPPGGSFDYVVPINSSGQHGTYWWHAHAKVSFFSLPLRTLDDAFSR